jgi:hypothetical protein
MWLTAMAKLPPSFLFIILFAPTQIPRLDTIVSFVTYSVCAHYLNWFRIKKLQEKPDCARRVVAVTIAPNSGKHLNSIGLPHFKK